MDWRIICDRCGERDFVKTIQNPEIWQDIAIPENWHRHYDKTYCAKCWKQIEYESARP